jgi:hypothetical protein
MNYRDILRFSRNDCTQTQKVPPTVDMSRLTKKIYEEVNGDFGFRWGVA